jgi:hypothetical protein
MNKDRTRSDSDANLTQVNLAMFPSQLRSLRTRHPKPHLITKLIEQTKSYQDGTGNPAMLPKLMARTLRQLGENSQ